MFGLPRPFLSHIRSESSASSHTTVGGMVENGEPIDREQLIIWDNGAEADGSQVGAALPCSF